MKFKKVTEEGIPYGDEIIAIIQFNYDGKGSFLVIADGELEYSCVMDLDESLIDQLRTEVAGEQLQMPF